MILWLWEAGCWYSIVKTFCLIMRYKAVVLCEKVEMKDMICGCGEKAEICGSGTTRGLPSMLVDARRVWALGVGLGLGKGLGLGDWFGLGGELGLGFRGGLGLG